MIFKYAGVLALLALAVWAPGSQAAIVPFGSSLSANADVAEARPSDTAYWQTGPAAIAGTAPASGQIRAFRIKGMALSDHVPGTSGGETDFHLQALRPQADGRFLILRTSGNFNLPQRGADPQTITTYQPVNFCVGKGEVLAFNTVGGFAPGPYPNGTPLQIFARNPGALVSQFNGADQTNNGDVLTPDTARGQNQELLMQLTLGTGSDSTGLCPTDTAPVIPPGGTPPPPPVGLPPRTVAPRATITSKTVSVTRQGSLTVALFCKVGKGSSCAGKVSVLSRGANPRVLASKSYAIAAAKTRKVTLRLSSTGRRQFARAKQKLRVSIKTVTKPGGAAGTVTKAFTLRRRGS